MISSHRLLWLLPSISEVVSQLCQQEFTLSYAPQQAHLTQHYLL